MKKDEKINEGQSAPKSIKIEEKQSVQKGEKINKGQSVSTGIKVPTGVKIISFLYYIGAVFLIISGLLFIAGAGMLGAIIDQIPLLGVLGTGLFVVAGVIMIVLGLLGFFIGRSLWTAKPWARIVVIILATLGVITAVVYMIQGDVMSNILTLVINLFIGAYLLFHKKVKQAFA